MESTNIDKKTPMKLYFFHMAGRSEAIRVACHYGNILLDPIKLTFLEFKQLKEVFLITWLKPDIITYL